MKVYGLAKEKLRVAHLVERFHGAALRVSKTELKG